MIYQELYDQMIDECYELPDDLPSWVTGGMTPSELLANNDPIMYRCGFADWLDALEEQQCCDCDRVIPHEFTVSEMCMDDEVTCEVCRGLKFECVGCEELFDVDEQSSGDDPLCSTCFYEREDDRGNEE